MSLKQREYSRRPRYTPVVKPVPLTSTKGYFFLVLFPLPFMAIGLWILGVYFQLFPIDRSKVNVPMEVLAGVGLIFFMAGFSIFLPGLKNLMVSLKMQAIRQMYPDSPWRWDLKWNPAGDIKGGAKSIINNFLGLIFLTLFFSPFYYFMLTQKKFPTFAKVIVIILSLLFFSIAIYNLFKSFKYTKVKCLFLDFPFQLGQEASITIHGLPKVEDIKSFKIELRCLESRVETVKRNNKTETKRVFYELYKLSNDVDLHQVHNGQYQANISLPADLNLATDFTLDNYRFWELRAIADTKGIDYNFGFLLPIY